METPGGFFRQPLLSLRHPPLPIEYTLSYPTLHIIERSHDRFLKGDIPKVDRVAMLIVVDSRMSSTTLEEERGGTGLI